MKLPKIKMPKLHWPTWLPRPSKKWFGTSELRYAIAGNVIMVAITVFEIWATLFSKHPENLRVAMAMGWAWMLMYYFLYRAEMRNSARLRKHTLETYEAYHDFAVMVARVMDNTEKNHGPTGQTFDTNDVNKEPRK